MIVLVQIGLVIFILLAVKYFRQYQQIELLLGLEISTVHLIFSLYPDLANKYPAIYRYSKAHFGFERNYRNFSHLYRDEVSRVDTYQSTAIANEAMLLLDEYKNTHDFYALQLLQSLILISSLLQFKQYPIRHLLVNIRYHLNFGLHTTIHTCIDFNHQQYEHIQKSLTSFLQKKLLQIN